MTDGVKYSDSPYAPDWARAPSPRQPKEAAAPAAPERPSVAELQDVLWEGTDEDVRVYGIFDGAWASELYGRLLGTDLSWAHMYQGGTAIKEPLEAPYIVALERDRELTRFLLDRGWGRAGASISPPRPGARSNSTDPETAIRAGSAPRTSSASSSRTPRASKTPFGS